MARFEDTPGLFGVGVGGGTYGDVTCDWCGTEYTGREGKDGEATGDEAISITYFGDLQIASCCFEKVEEAVLSHIDVIVPWFTRILRKKRNRLSGQEGRLKELQRVLSETVH